LALAWALPDERSPVADAFWRDEVGHAELWVPALWWYEVGNALIVARRRSRLCEADVARLVELYSSLPLGVDVAGLPAILHRCTLLAWETGMSVYDAAYLELAGRRGAGLATLDERLREQAAGLGIGTWATEG
jgi:predicted nucleic acid-binding protein